MLRSLSRLAQRFLPLPLLPLNHWNGLGPHTLSIRVLFDGYDVIEVPVQAYVAFPVRAEPPVITAYKDQKTGELPLSGEITVNSLDHKPFHILSVHGDAPPFVDFDPAK